MRYTGINLMVPTRRRQRKVWRLIESTRAMATDMSRVRFSFLVDPQEQSTVDFLTHAQTACPRQIITNAEPGPPNLARFYNQLYEATEYVGDEWLVSMVGDDMYWLTIDWDGWILDAVNRHDGLGIFHCDDCYLHHGRIPVNLFMARPFIRAACGDTMKWMDERFCVDFIDVVWREVADRIGQNHYLSNVKLHHDHEGRKPRGEQDTTIRRLRARVHEARKHAGAIPGIVEAHVRNLRDAGVMNS
jgi:hypothetical protein